MNAIYRSDWKMSAEELGTTIDFAWNVYRGCKYAGNNAIAGVAREVISIYISLKEVREVVENSKNTETEGLREICIGVHEALNDVQAVVKSSAHVGLLGVGVEGGMGQELERTKQGLKTQLRLVEGFVDEARE